MAANPWSISAVLLYATIYISTAQAQSNAEALWPLQQYESTRIETPFLNVTRSGKTEPGYLFVSPLDVLREVGHPAIYEDNGELVWQGEEGNIFGLQPQILDGNPVLTYWNGTLNITGFGIGAVTILNSSYDEIYKVTLGSDQGLRTIYEPEIFDSYIDLHEQFITDQGSILVTATNVSQADLRSVGGPQDGWIITYLVYEIDIKTNKILFSWNPLDHLDQIPFTLSRFPLYDAGRTSTHPWNWIHLNSVAKYGDSYLVSSRYLCSVFLVLKDGSISWRLDDFNGGDFNRKTNTEFCYQHDVRLKSINATDAVLHMHNNYNTEESGPAHLTTGLEITLNFAAKTATSDRRMWSPNNPVFVVSQGSYQPLANGHVLLGHGATPVIEEYDQNGAIVMDARFGYDRTLQSYRAYRHAWTGVPMTRPSVKACSGENHGQTVLYVSWNGATGVEQWEVLSESADGKLDIIQAVPRNGFETKVLVTTERSNVTVRAIGGPNNGRLSDVTPVEMCQ